MTNYTGYVKSYWKPRGFGFVRSDNGGADIFLHATALQRSGWEYDDTPASGQRVRYTLKPRGEHRTQIDTIERDEA